MLDELVSAACHVTEQYANNAIEADHGRLKSRLRPMRGLKQPGCAQVISAGNAFIQNMLCHHYELGTEEAVNLRLRTAFDELAPGNLTNPNQRPRPTQLRTMQQLPRTSFGSKRLTAHDDLMP